MKRTSTPTNRTTRNQGMNWITQSKRLAIYLRDGLACAWCGATIETGAKLTLDHLTPHSHGGDNQATNLVTACLTCNSSRGNRSLTQFAKSVATYRNHGLTAKRILSHIAKQASTDLAPMKIEAAKLIQRRGSVANVLSAK